MMRWIVYVVAAVALLVIVVALIGATLPQNHTASRTVRMATPPDALFALLLAELAKPQEVPVRIERQERPSLLVTRVEPNRAFGGTWTYRIAPAPGGSDLTITEDGEVYNVIFRFMSRFVLGHYATMDAFLKNLKQTTEKHG